MWDEINTTSDFDLTDTSNQTETVGGLSPISFPPIINNNQITK